MVNKEKGYEEKIEEEFLYEKDEEARITEPFDPQAVDIISQPMTISNLVDQLKYGDIVLDPDFQRYANLWDDEKQSI